MVNPRDIAGERRKKERKTGHRILMGFENQQTTVISVSSGRSGVVCMLECVLLSSRALLGLSAVQFVFSSPTEAARECNENAVRKIVKVEKCGCLCRFEHISNIHCG